MKRIIVEFAGWVCMDPEHIRFVSLVDDSVITGDKYIELDKCSQADYIVENVIDAQRDCLDGDYTDISVEIEDEA